MAVSAQKQPSKPKKPKFDYTKQLKQDFFAVIDPLDIEPIHKAYLKNRWLDQVLWMDSKSSKMRDNHHRLRTAMIFCSALVPFFVAINIGRQDWDQAIKLLIAALSVVATVCATLDEFFSYSTRWYSYRKAAELLKTQGWQFLELSGRYREYEDHAEAFHYFVEDVEGIIQRDVEVYVTEGLRKRDDEKKPKSSERNTRLNDPVNPDAANNPSPR